MTNTMLHKFDFPSPDAQNVRLCPNIWLTPPEHVPTDLMHDIRGCEAFMPEMPNVWVKDALNGMIMPYWAPQEVLQAIQSSVYNLILQCPPSVKQWLEDRRMTADSLAGFSMPPLKQHTEQLKAQQYTVIRNLFPKGVLQRLAARIRQLHAEGKFQQCRQVPERSAINVDLQMRYYHLQLESHLNRIVTDKIKASYFYSVIYHEAAVLKRHTDRPQCLWNLSVPLEVRPEVTMETTWPIYLEINKEVHEIRLLPGDGVLYSGTDIPHWRDAQPPGMESTVTFYHFVAHDFTGSLA